MNFASRYALPTINFANSHKRLILIVQIACATIVGLSYAGFIDPPELITLPALLVALLTGLRYAVWEGVLKPRLEAQRSARAQSGEAPPA